MNKEESNGVNRSDGVNRSFGVNWSNGVNWSDGVNGSNGVNWSSGVNGSNGVSWSNGVNWSSGVNKSFGVNGSNGVSWSSGVNGSNGVNWSSGVNGSNGVNWSSGVNESFGVLKSFGVDKALFLANKKRTYSIFKTPVSEERFNKIESELYCKLDGWRPAFNNIKSLYLKHGSDWKKTPIENAEELSKEEAWRDMPRGAIDYVKSLPEFDSEIFKEITGIDVAKEEKVKITIDGKDIFISRESAEELKKNL